MLRYQVFKTGRAGMDGRSYVLWCTQSGQAVAVDPDCCAQAQLAYLQQMGCTLVGILLTHGHFDHTGDVDCLRKKTAAKVYIGARDAAMLGDATRNASALLGHAEVHQAADVLLHGGEEIPLGEHTLRVLAAPGHTAGGMCYAVQSLLCSGDTLMRGALGRYDLPEADVAAYPQTLHTLLCLPPDTLVLPGHGAMTTIGAERLRYLPKEERL